MEQQNLRSAVLSDGGILPPLKKMLRQAGVARTLSTPFEAACSSGALKATIAEQAQEIEQVFG